jgi:dihydroorotase-like cyclic amidohydrolase
LHFEQTVHHVFGHFDHEHHEITRPLREQLDRLVLWNKLKNEEAQWIPESPPQKPNLIYSIDAFMKGR